MAAATNIIIMCWDGLFFSYSLLYVHIFMFNGSKRRVNVNKSFLCWKTYLGCGWWEKNRKFWNWKPQQLSLSMLTKIKLLFDAIREEGGGWGDKTIFVVHSKHLAISTNFLLLIETKSQIREEKKIKLNSCFSLCHFLSCTRYNKNALIIFFLFKFIFVSKQKFYLIF